MPFDDKLLEILVCPETKQSLKLIDQQALGSVNAKISSSELVSRGGQLIDKPVDGALVREDGKYAYPIRGDIPVMLTEESFEMPE